VICFGFTRAVTEGGSSVGNEANSRSVRTIKRVGIVIEQRPE
jgi:hypothetical protein